MVLKDRIVGDFHCVLSIVEGGKIQVDDLKSHYGTFVNGQKISRVLLNDGDELQIGFTRIEWQKLKPALLEMEQSNVGQVPSDEEIQDLYDHSLAKGLEEQLGYQPKRYQIDATEQLIEEAELRFLQTELDYPAKPILRSSESVNLTDTTEAESTTEALDVESHEKVAYGLDQGSKEEEHQTFGQNSSPETTSKQPSKNSLVLYYWLLGAVLFGWIAFMVWVSA